MAETFSNISALTGTEQKFYIRQNYREILKYIIDNKNAISTSPEKANIVLIVMANLFDGKAFYSNIEIVSQLLLAMITKETYSEIRFYADQFLKNMFTTFCTSSTHKEGLVFFNTINAAVDSSMFMSMKAYIMYFSYHTKDYSGIHEMMSSKITYVDLSQPIENVEHSMYYYYKALIHLRLAEFENAYISFSVCLQSFVLQKGLLITSLQLEAIKHIIIMSFIPSLEKFKSLNTFLFSKMKRLQNLKELEAFSDLYLTKEINFSMWIEKNKLILKQAKLLGLTKIAYKEYEKHKIVTTLKKYKKIHVKTLIQILDISEESLVFYLKLLIQKNEMNIQYDEVENIIEVLPIDYCNEDMFDKLKENYECLINETNDTANAIKLIKEVHLKKPKPTEMDMSEKEQHFPSNNRFGFPY